MSRNLPSRLSKLDQEIDLDALAFAIARNKCGADEDVDLILTQENITPDKFLALLEDKLFQNKIKNYIKELQENGVSFQLQARLQAEDLLKKQYILIHDPDTPPAVTIKAIENTVRWAGLEPKTGQNALVSGTNPGFQIIFNLNHPNPDEKIIEIEQK